jgi:hypothetical protein
MPRCSDNATAMCTDQAPPQTATHSSVNCLQGMQFRITFRPHRTCKGHVDLCGIIRERIVILE